MHHGVLDAMIHGSDRAERAGLDAMGLYFLAQSYACAYLTDGAVARRAAERIAGRRTTALAARLVAAGLWLVDGDGWRFADWMGQPTRASVEAAEEAERVAEAEIATRRRMWAERQRFHRSPNYAATFERDGDVCRYCGDVGANTVDHIVPMVLGGGYDLENLAVACRSCNSSKGGRTPEQAGMTLRPSPGKSPGAIRTARYRERRASLSVTRESQEASQGVTESVTDASHAASPERHGSVTSRDPDLRISGSGSGSGSALDLFQPDLKTSSPETAGARSTGRAKPKRAKSEPSDAERGYAEAFAAGVVDAVGGTFAPPVDSHSRYLFRSVWAHAKGSDGASLTGVALLAWIRQTAAEYRRAKPNDARFGGFTIKNWLTWLNAGRPRDEARPDFRQQPAPAAERCWTPPTPEETTF